MKTLSILFAVAASSLLLAISGVKAQTNTSTSGATSGSVATSGSSSISTSQGGNAGATNTSTNGAAANTGASSVNFSTGNNSPYTVNNPGDVTIRSAPTVYAPSVVTGNVCALGASAAASWLGAGLAIGGTWESVQCENRHRVALLFNMGEKAAAKEVLCDTREVYEGFKRVGAPCVVRPDWEPKDSAGKPVQPIAMPAPPRVTPFNAGLYASASECLTAANLAGQPLNVCAGKK